ncbi:Sodium/hydrogen exchanger [Dirofilaria immitis]|nr:Sodium/hydrogen exchanger [Dirofilaria immitis]
MLIMEFEWHDLNTPLSICLWLLSIILAKIISHSSKRFTIVPDSALLILVGFAVGSILDRFWPHEIYLHPALDAGYALPNKAFFENFGTIILYAVIGTVWNIISIVDPVAVLSVFEEIKVNRLLYICVFGESLLNDAVTVVMYHALAAMAKIEPENLEANDFIKALASFFLVSFGGILIGIVGATLTGLATNIVLCGLMMKQYLAGNLSKQSLVTTSTYFLTCLANRGRHQKINLVDQFIMAYGGLRGAICYGLVMTLDKDAVLAKEMFASTTIIVILTTVFLQGATIKPLVKLLDVEVEPDKDETLVEQVISDVRDDIMEGIEAVAGIQRSQRIRQKISNFNNDYILPCIVRNQRTRADELLAIYDKQ